MKFCSNCNNVLTRIFDRYNIKFKCPKCNLTYDAAPEDSLIMSESDAITENNKIDVFTRYAHNDKTITLVKRQCPSCSSDIVKQLLIGKQENVIFICNECDTRFRLE